MSTGRSDASFSMNADCISVVAVGDVMLGRGVTEALEQRGSSLLGDSIETLVGDVVTGNLECVLTERLETNSSAHACFAVAPRLAESILGRFDMLALANNHVYDFLDDGVADTLQALASLEIAHAGIGVTASAARQPAVLVRHGKSIALFSAATTVSYPPGRSRYVVATPDSQFIDGVGRAVRVHDLVIVHLHAGGGDYPYPAPDVRHLHDKILGTGAQVVLGHHPHVIQGWRSDPTKFDAFSLGDFIFDSTEGGRREALVLSVDSCGSEIRSEVRVVERCEDLSLRLASTKTQPQLDKRLDDLCRPLAEGTSDQRYFDVAGRDYMSVMTLALSKDVASGGWRALLGRVRRLTPGKLWRGLRLAARAVRVGASRGSGS